MRIERVEPILAGRSLLVKVYTDEGIVGHGEAGLWAHHRWVYAAIQDLADYYVGKDPARMEHHFQTLSRDTHFMGSVIGAALSAMDIAMWDILGHSVDRPVHALLGGRVRDKVRVFANVVGATLDERAESARHQVERGFGSLRTTPMFADFEKQSPTKVIKDAVEIVRTIREAVGDEVDLGLEIHRNLAPDQAILLARELLPYRILYYEDPLAPESLAALRYIAPHVPLPIATGERFWSIYQFKELVDSQTVAMIRPDLSLAGGFTQCKKISGMAEAALVGVFPHLMGSPVNTAAYVQFAAATPNYVLMEYGDVDRHPLNDAVSHSLVLDQGYIRVPDDPGIGVAIDDDALAHFPFEDRTISGSFAADGSVAH